MYKTIAMLVSGASLLLLGCNRMESANPSEESCALCHTASLNEFAVHRVHLSHNKMGTFPYRGIPVDASLDSIPQTRLERYNIECTACHAGTKSVSNPVYKGLRVNPAYHRNGKVDIVFDTGFYLGAKFITNDSTRFDYAAETCNNIACHGFGRHDTLNVTWNAAPVNEDSLTGKTLDCTFCHIVSTAVGAAHGGGARCNSCHSGKINPSGKFIPDITTHINGVLDTL
jgi:predicted CxxxxCH...CXXCH cytochrome family protein